MTTEEMTSNVSLWLTRIMQTGSYVRKLTSISLRNNENESVIFLITALLIPLAVTKVVSVLVSRNVTTLTVSDHEEELNNFAPPRNLMVI